MRKKKRTGRLLAFAPSGRVPVCADLSGVACRPFCPALPASGVPAVVSARVSVAAGHAFARAVAVAVAVFVGAVPVFVLAAAASCRQAVAAAFARLAAAFDQFAAAAQPEAGADRLAAVFARSNCSGPVSAFVGPVAARLFGAPDPVSVANPEAVAVVSVRVADLRYWRCLGAK